MRSHPLVQVAFCIDRRRPARARIKYSHVLRLIAILPIVVVAQTSFGVIARARAETHPVWLLHSGGYLGLHFVRGGRQLPFPGLSAWCSGRLRTSAFQMQNP